jgi:hypothetical protein
VIFFGAMSVGDSWSDWVVILAGSLTGVVAGLVLGLVTSPFLSALDGPPLRHRVILAVLRSRMVHRADRDGDGALVGLAVQGAVSGRWFRFPVAAARTRAGDVVVMPGHANRKTWWRNVPARPDVEVFVHGTWQPGTAVLLRCGDPRWDQARTAYAARFRDVRSSGQPFVMVRLASRDEGPAASGPRAVDPTTART